MNKPLPPGITQSKFDEACAELREAIGADAVFTDDERDLRSYNDAYSTVDDSEHAPSAAVTPRDVEDIQQILAVARKFGIPLWTISTGRNFAYGGPAPRKAGYIVLDLKRMNRILEVNEKHAYAVVEPGVSYFDLYAHLQKSGSRLWIDCAAPGWGGALGNLVDRGVGYTPYGEHFMVQCGMQVVLADGTVVDTAMGAVPESTTSHLYKYGRGPWVDGIFTQSNFGIVTKVGIWLMPQPPGYRPYMITFPREDDLHQITELVRPLKLNMVVPSAAMTVGLIWEAGVKVTKAQYHDGKGPLPSAARRKIMDDLQIGEWNFYGALYGPEPVMDANWRLIEDSFRQVEGAKFFNEANRGEDPAFAYRAKLMRGIPNMTEFSLQNWVGSGAHIDFSPMSPVTGDDAMKQYRMIQQRANEYGFDYIGEFVVGWRDMHHIFFLAFERSDEDQRRRAHELFGVLIDEAAAEGYGEYRTHLDFMDQIAATYDWNDRALWRVHERIKDRLDPDGILSPGKMGIWPKRMRQS